MKLKALILFAFVGSLCATMLHAQDTPSDTSYWKKGGFGSVTFAQVILDNWAAGGQTTANVNGVLSLFADFTKGRATWNNTLDLGYGVIRQGASGNFTKSDDKINLVTKYGYQINENNTSWYYSGLLDFRTQFWEGLDANDSLVISKFMAPAYLTIGLGVDYKPNTKWSFNYIPLTGKFTIVMDDDLSAAGAYGVPAGTNGRAEMGSYFRAVYQGNIMENITLDSRIELFSNYLKDFGILDMNWQNALVMKVNKFLTANLYTQMIYDKDIKIANEAGDKFKARLQYKRVFGVGVSYAFGDKR